MTRIDSVCVKCENLIASESGVDISCNIRSLISQCVFGGKNAGNRKSCKKFKKASDEIIESRLKLLRGDRK